MHVFKHPKYYEEFRQRAKRAQKELRERNKSDQAISSRAETSGTSVRPGPGLKPQATNDTTASGLKLQATGSRLQAPSSDKKE